MTDSVRAGSPLLLRIRVAQVVGMPSDEQMVEIVFGTSTGPEDAFRMWHPHGLTETHKEKLNKDLLTFLKA